MEAGAVKGDGGAEASMEVKCTAKAYRGWRLA